MAGLVGLGLSKLFSVSELERPAIAEQDALSNHMGLFLQKTNIIRDYLEDINEVAVELRPGCGSLKYIIQVGPSLCRPQPALASALKDALAAQKVLFQYANASMRFMHVAEYINVAAEPAQRRPEAQLHHHAAASGSSTRLL